MAAGSLAVLCWCSSLLQAVADLVSFSVKWCTDEHWLESSLVLLILAMLHITLHVCHYSTNGRLWSIDWPHATLRRRLALILSGNGNSRRPFRRPSPSFCQPSLLPCACHSFLVSPRRWRRRCEKTVGHSLQHLLTKQQVEHIFFRFSYEEIKPVYW